MIDSIGKHTCGKPKVLDWNTGAKLRIGAFCSIARKVTIILSGEHRTDWVTTFPLTHHFLNSGIDGHPTSKGDVVIGNDVWIGHGATILSGVTIGDGAVIGAYSVVAKNVPAYCIAVGNPAKVIRQRFTDEQVQSLLKIKWWEWEDCKILDHSHLLLSDNIDDFIKEFEL